MKGKAKFAPLPAKKASPSKTLNHPYKQFESTRMWRRLDKAVDELVRNKDIIETTRREYIVGHLYKILAAARRLKPKE